jgi:hypothetical protein
MSTTPATTPPRPGTEVTTGTRSGSAAPAAPVVSGTDWRIDPPSRRPSWRQDLVDTERGLVVGFRSDAGIVSHLFAGSIVVVAGVLFGLSPTQWVLVCLTLSGLLTCEMFRQAIRVLALGRTAVQDSDQPGMDESRRGLSECEGMLLGGMTIARIGAITCLGVIFAERLWPLLTGP